MVPAFVPSPSHIPGGLWFGKRSAQMCAIWKQVRGAEQDRVVCIMGGFSVNEWVNDQALRCPLWVADGGQPCAEQMDALAVVPYFGAYPGSPSFFTGSYLERNECN